MNNGWIKLHRKFLTWEWANKPEMVSLFIYLLLSANNADSRWQGIEVKRGQLITGRKRIHEVTGISEQSIRTCFEALKSTNEITIKSTNKYSLVTIVNYDSYQSVSEKSTSTSTSKLTNNQPATNHKQEVKKLRSKEKEPTHAPNVWAWWIAVNKESNRAEPVRCGQDLSAGKRIGQAFPDEAECKSIMRMYLADRDRYLESRGWPLSVLAQRLNKYNNSASYGGDIITIVEADAIEAECKRQNEKAKRENPEAYALMRQQQREAIARAHEMFMGSENVN